MFKSVFFILATCGWVLLSAIPQREASKSTRYVNDTIYDQLTEEQKRSAKYALAGLSVENNLQVDLFAAEPMLVNPTNIAVDHRGRVWVCEAYNYRNEITGQQPSKKGDRILILEDTDQDGKADKSTTFYQDPELNAPIGIWVLGNKVIVSQSPYVWLLTDEDGDNKADKKEIIFQGIEGVQHDHGMHAFVMGPDGRYYFNFGNEGKKLLDAKGNPLVGKDGKTIDFSQYKQGLVFRCDADFTNFEVIGQNFRNNYEVAVDSYGSLWQSDNDDDGNRGVRINYVMEYGNYGYTDEITGAGWRAYRTNWEDSIPERHWHLNDPGVVPNVLQTGAGSPTGLAIYEGQLLPSVYHHQMIHTDAGPNVVRSYPVVKVGAGYKGRIVPMVKGTKDQWFRPTDVAVAPDGSLFVSDWYDPGVGGHQMGDATRGRIYRIVPKNYDGYKVPVLAINTLKGAIQALENPNLEARALARQALLQGGIEAHQALMHVWDTTKDTRLRARVLWILGQHPHANQPILLSKGAKESNPNLRIVTIRLARQLNSPILASLLQELSLDTDAAVRREVAIALRDCSLPVDQKATVWVNLAKQHTGNDRWYLEALGIGAEGNWEEYFNKWLASTPNALTTVGNKDIIWRARTVVALPWLKELASDPQVPLKERLRYFRAFDFIPAEQEKSEVLMSILAANKADTSLQALVFHHLPPSYVKSSPEAMSIINQRLAAYKGTKQYVEVVKKYALDNQNDELLQLLLSNGGNDIGRSAASLLLQQSGGIALLKPILERNEEDRLSKIIPAIRSVGNEVSVKILEDILLGKESSVALKKQAILALGGSMVGEDVLIKNLREGRITDELKETTYEAVKNAWRKAVRNEVQQYVSKGIVVEGKTKHPSVATLLTRTGNAAKGKEVFELYCSSCHQVGDQGYDFGPKLTEIGDKLPKQGQYLAIISPSAGISFGYEGTSLVLHDGTRVAGIITSKTAEAVTLKFPGGASQEYAMQNIKSMTPLTESMMTEGLAEAMSTEQLVNLVEYLLSLKK